MEISPSLLEPIGPFSDFETTIKINEQKSPSEIVYSGKIIISNQEYESFLPVKITIEIPLEEIKEVEPSTFLKEEFEVEGVQEESPDVTSAVEEIIPWGELSGEYEDETKLAGTPIVLLIAVLLIIAIIIFLLSGKKTTKKKSFKEIVKEAGRK